MKSSPCRQMETPPLLFLVHFSCTHARCRLHRNASVGQDATSDMPYDVDLGQLRLQHDASGLYSAIRSTATVSCLDKVLDLLVAKDKLLSHDTWVGCSASLQIALDVDWDPSLNILTSQDALRQHVLEMLGNAPVGHSPSLLSTQLTVLRCGPN